MPGQTVSLTVENEDIRRLIDDLQDIRNGVPRALSSGVNRVLSGTRTDMARETYKQLALKKKRILKDIWIAKEASPSDPTGIVMTEGRPINLSQYNASEVKKGLKVRIYRNEPRKLIKHAFLAKVKNPDNEIYELAFWRKNEEGHVGTRRRKPWMRYGKLPREYRLPVKDLWGPRIQDITAKEEVLGRIEESSRQRLKTELARQADRLLKRAKRT